MKVIYAAAITPVPRLPDIAPISEGDLAWAIEVERQTHPHLSELGAASVAYSMGVKQVYAAYELERLRLLTQAEKVRHDLETSMAKTRAEEKKEAAKSALMGGVALGMFVFLILWKVPCLQ